MKATFTKAQLEDIFNIEIDMNSYFLVLHGHIVDKLIEVTGRNFENRDVMVSHDGDYFQISVNELSSQEILDALNE